MKKTLIATILLVSVVFFCGCTQDENKYPEVKINILSSTGNIWATKEHTIKVNVSWATEAFINNESLEIKDGIIEKDVILDDLSRDFTIQARNPWNFDFKILSLTREKTENEILEEQVKLSYDSEFLLNCTSQIKNDSEAAFNIVWMIEVSEVYEYNETPDKIEGKFIEKVTANPIRNIHYTNTYSCSKNKKSKKVDLKLLDMKSETDPCPDWSNPPLWMRCR